MKRICLLILSLCMIGSVVFGTVSVSAAVSGAEMLYVANVISNQTPDGTKSNPFTDIQSAVDKAKTITEKNVVINIREGMYKVTESIDLSDVSNLTLRAYPGENVEITGGEYIDLSDFVDLSNDEKARIGDETEKNKVKVKQLDVDVTESMGMQGFALGGAARDYAPILRAIGSTMELTIASYPNGSEFLEIENVSKSYDNLTGDERKNLFSISQLEDKDTLGYSEYTLTGIGLEKYSTWAAKEEDVWARAYLDNNWADAVTPAVINETTVKTYTQSSYPAGTTGRVKFMNILYELDQAGEWYLDTANNKLYVYPADDMEKLFFSDFNLPLIKATAGENITVSGIKFTGTRAGDRGNSNDSRNMAAGIEVRKATNFVIDNCEISDIGNRAVYFNNCSKSGIKNSNLHDLGSYGVVFYGCGKKETLTSGECYVKNCTINNFSNYRRTYSPAIQTVNGDVGTYIGHNTISDGTNLGIIYASTGMVMEYNKIYNVCTEVADNGAIYSGRRYDTVGNVIRNNYIHDIKQSDEVSGYKVNAIYLDDCHSSTKILNNIFEDVDSACLIGGGRNNEFSGNIIIGECSKSALELDARGISENAHRLESAFVNSDPLYWINESWLKSSYNAQLKDLLVDILTVSENNGYVEKGLTDFVKSVFEDPSNVNRESEYYGNLKKLLSKHESSDDGCMACLFDKETGYNIRNAAGFPEWNVVQNNTVTTEKNTFKFAEGTGENHDNTLQNPGVSNYDNWENEFKKEDAGANTANPECYSDITLSVSGASEGYSVKINGYDLTGDAVQKMENGYYDIEITAPEEYVIKSVSLGETKLIETGRDTCFYGLISNTADAALNIEFKTADITSPSITVNQEVAVGYQPVWISSSNGESLWVIHNSFIAYADVNYGTEEDYVTGLGCKLNPSEKTTAQVTLPVEKANVSEGKFAIRVYGDGMDSGKYQLTPYVTYGNAEITGDTAEINID